MEIVADRLTEMRSHPRAGAARPILLITTGVLALVGLGACASSSDDQAADSTAATPASGSSAPPALEESAAADDAPPSTAPSAAADCPATTRLTLTVPGTSAPRFAGYHAALQRGLYSAACLDVAIITAADAPQALATLSAGTADLAVSPLAEGLRVRESGSAIVNVAQVFQRSGTIQVSLVASGIDTPAAYRGKRIGLGGAGGWEVLAATAKAGLDPVADTTLVAGGGTEALLAGEVDAAAAQTFDGYQRILGRPHPTTGQPLSAQDLTVIDYQADGVGLLPDGLWVGADRTTDAAGADAIQRFVTASLRGWIGCRDDAAACAALPDVAPGGDIELGTRMVQAVNALIWPSPLGVGVIDPVTRDRTVQVALVTKDLEGGRLITREPDEGSIITTFATEADSQLAAEGLNVTG